MSKRLTADSRMGVHFLTIMGVGIDVLTPWFAMELFGTSLSSYLKSTGALEQHLLCLVTRQLAAAISFMHGLQLAHLDLKPGNILLQGNLIKLIDFGMTEQLPLKAAPGELAPFSTYITELYRPPELFQRATVASTLTLSADIWSFGVTVFELACNSNLMSPVFPSRTVISTVQTWSSLYVSSWASGPQKESRRDQNTKRFLERFELRLSRLPVQNDQCKFVSMKLPPLRELIVGCCHPVPESRKLLVTS